MICLILAAGQGTRLRAVAPSKPLARVFGVPLIERVVDAARRGGADRFVVVTGYAAEPLEAFLAELSQRQGVEIDCVRNAAWDGPNGLSVVAAAERLTEPFALLMADHLFEPEILRAMIAQPRTPGTLTLAVDRRLDNPLVDLEDVTRVRTGPDGRIRDIGKGLADYDAFDTGVFIAPPELVEAIAAESRAGREASLSAGVRALAQGGRARTWDIGERFWLDVDDAIAFGHAERAEARLAIGG